MDSHISKIIFYLLSLILIIDLFACSPNPPGLLPEKNKSEISQNAKLATEGWKRSNWYMNAWLDYADPESGLLPRNLDGGHGQDIWNARDCAADNYPFLVLTSFFTDHTKYQGVMRDILTNEKRLTSRVKSLPDTWSFSKNDFDNDEVDMERIIFGTSEYIKDGLLPLTEWLGESPWLDRMLTMLHDLDKYVDVAGVSGQGFGRAAKAEVNGELLQILSRMYWMTGEEQLLDWAINIGDYYMLGEGFPLTQMDYLRLRDHGCELVAGLCELYATLQYVDQDKKHEYKASLYRLLDAILEHGRNDDGLFYNAINPQTGQVVDSSISDGWGYMLNGYYDVYMVDSLQVYQDAVSKVFRNLHKYRNFNWERQGADGYADAVEGAINLYNRIPDQKAADWIDSEIQVMWSMQDSAHRQNAQRWKGKGIIEGWYGDGNFARTSIMYCLWKTQGTWLQPWNSDLRWGATTENNKLLLTIHSPEDWDGTLFFDKARHNKAMNLPLDWPRINQFPEWYVIHSDQEYNLYVNGEMKHHSGEDLLAGLEISLKANQMMEMVIEER